MLELSVVIPAYNEAARIERTLQEVDRWLARHHASSEIVVSDDGSRDDTSERVERLGLARVVLVRNPQNRGKGASVRSGVLRATGEAVAFFDADLAYPLDQLELLLARLRDGADVAVGARDLLRDENREGYRPLRRMATAAFNALVAVTLGLRNGDTQCGFKAFRREAARALFSALTVERFGFDVELLYLAERWGLRVDRVPVRMRASDASSVNVLRDSFDMARDVLRIRSRARRNAYPSRP